MYFVASPVFFEQKSAEIQAKNPILIIASTFGVAIWKMHFRKIWNVFGGVLPWGILNGIWVYKAIDCFKNNLSFVLSLYIHKSMQYFDSSSVSLSKDLGLLFGWDY